MKRLLVLVGILSFGMSLLLPQSSLANEDDYEQDAAYAEGNPPVVPHEMKPGATGEACLVCHLEGKNGAPLSPHAVRIDCVQCHVQGEIKDKKPAQKSADKKKRKRQESQ